MMGKIPDLSAIRDWCRSRIENKVDKVAGKGLSTNDFTTEEKTKLRGIAADANKTIYTNNLAATVEGTALDAVQGKNLNDKIANISENLGVVRRGFGIMSIDNGTVIRGSVSMEKISDKKCNIMIKARIEQREGSPDLWYLFDIGKVSALVNLKSLSWEAQDSILHLDQSGCPSDGVIQPDYLGYGLCTICNGGHLDLGRIYNEHGAFGGYSANSYMYTPETVYYIWVQGADYTE